MESKMKSLVTLFCLFICCNASRILEKDPMFIDPEKPSAFDSNLNVVMANGGAQAEMTQTGLPCEETAELNSWSSSAINETEKKTQEVEIKLPENRTRGDEEKGEKLVFNVLPKGSVTPSGPSPRGNAAINGEGLARSMVPAKVDKKGESHVVGHMEGESDGNKRLLGSAPSRGAGH